MSEMYNVIIYEKGNSIFRDDLSSTSAMLAAYKGLEKLGFVDTILEKVLENDARLKTKVVLTVQKLNSKQNRVNYYVLTKGTKLGTNGQRKVVLAENIEAKLEEFKNLASVAELTMLMGNNGKQVERTVEYQHLYSTALSLGLVETSADFAIDFKRHGIWFKKYNRIVTFDIEKISTNSNTITEMQEKSALDKSVVTLSAFGYDALKYIYLEISGKKVYFNSFIKWLRSEMNVQFDSLSYIGITPNNKLLKIATNYAIYSVAFSDFATFETLNAKGKLIPSNSAHLYASYCRRVIREKEYNNDFYCTKYSYKDYSNYGASRNGENVATFLKSKYKTLQDVYVNR